MISKLTFLILTLLFINEQVNCEFESSLIFSNKQKDEKSSELSNTSENLMKLPKVINLPRDNESIIPKSDDGKAMAKKLKPKKKGKVIIKGKVLDGTNSQVPAEPDYDDEDEDELDDDEEIAKQIDKLTDPKSQANGPIYPIKNQVPPIQQPQIPLKDNQLKPPYQAEDKQPSKSVSTDKINDEINKPIENNFKGEASLNYDDNFYLNPTDQTTFIDNSNRNKNGYNSQSFEIQYTTTLQPPPAIKNYKAEINSNKDLNSDFIDEAKKLSNKLGYQESNKDEIDDYEQSNKINDLGDSSKLEPHGADDKAESESESLVYPSVYKLFKEKMDRLYEKQQKLKEQKLQEQQQAVINPTVVASLSSSTSPLPPASSSTPTKTTNKIVNLSPKIVFTKPSSFPSMDLFRRSCAIKINGLNSLGICRNTCGQGEIGIQAKLKETCTSYQLTCNDPFELCCVPNLSEYGECNIDLFKPTEILNRVEKSLNLPSNSLIKLSHLQPAYLDSILNYRSIYPQTHAMFKDKSSNYYNLNKQINEMAYNITRPMIHSKKVDSIRKENDNRLELKSLKEDSDLAMHDLAPHSLESHFMKISNQSPRLHRQQIRFAKVLRRVDNPTPNSRSVRRNSYYHN